MAGATRKTTWLKPLIALALVAVVAVLVHATGAADLLDLETLKQRQTQLDAWISGNLWLALALFFALYVVVTAFSIPGAAVMTVAAGALFGLLAGTVLVSFASTIGATLAFLVARFLLRGSLRAKFGRRLEKIDAGIQRDGAFYLFTLRLVPVFPFFVINLLAGLTALRTWTFYWVSQLGMLPATVVYVFAGTQLARIESLGDVLSPGLIGAFVVIGLLPLLMRWLARWLQGRRVYRGHRRPARFDYNLLVIGAGSAGLVSAYIASAVKAKVALVEKHRMGGDCLNTGCVPSKALIRTARLLAEARDSARYGVRRMDAHFDFAQAMDRVQDVIRRIEPHDSVERYTSLGVDVVQGEAKLVSPWEVEVDGRRISARSIVLATGARPLLPELPGLADAAPLSSDTLWSLRELPGRLLVLGGGPIGCELAQVFARFGSRVRIVEMAPRLLPREDEDAAQALHARLETEGLDIATGHEALRVEEDGDGKVLVCRHSGGEVAFGFDRILVALGRKANVEGFGLEALGVELTGRGTIAVDALMRTNFPNIHVAGDVAGPFQFTHVAAHQAWFASVNALLAPFWSFKADYRVIPWVTFTDPEVARVGLSEDEAEERGVDVEVTKYGIDDLDRAIADGNDHGYVKVLTPPGKDRILGATIVGAHAGELLAEFVLAMKHGIGLNKLLGTIHVYPTMGEANKYAAGVWKKAHAPQSALRWAERFFRWRRG
ncbi:FAD-dependent oxidoreductase [Alkalisalibacterium limincola]|uniref:Pyridine nucleotide-disulfide oxidoreductase n=1 Tax=Alkalisalibacterium limincola TaxID=2699169 RepID=A0A5C8KRQ3_9GAMM|nr:FAD-dependent oxidoreductase [Alkalisalibacterium limincola]TXK62135.1 pyridine nucleotide-disulfide oxidoreductase [Alkalisalibacterium limincola]